MGGGCFRRGWRGREDELERRGKGTEIERKGEGEGSAAKDGEACRGRRWKIKRGLLQGGDRCGEKEEKVYML